MKMIENSDLFHLNDLMVDTGYEVIWGQVPNIIQTHAKIRQSGLLNFMYMRIPVQTQLKAHTSEQYLHCYWDKQLVDLILFGFPLNFDRSIQLKSTKINHTSALIYSDHVSKYIY